MDVFFFGGKMIVVKNVQITIGGHYLIGTENGIVGGTVVAIIDSVYGNAVEIYTCGTNIKIMEKDIACIKRLQGQHDYVVAR